MKSLIYIIVSTFILAWLPVQSVLACLGSTYAPAQYYTFRCYDDSAKSESKDAKVQNCELWQTLTSAQIPIKDIQIIVYKSTYEEIERLAQLVVMPNAKDALMSNQFALWIVIHQDRELADFLLLAKLCEKMRWEQNSPWYYPVDNDAVSISLADIAAQARAYRGKRLRDRYALQAIRAMFATGQYDACINYWAEVRNQLPEGLIKRMILPYVAGAYFRTGVTEKAMQIYAECGDVESLIFCAGKQGQEINPVEQMKLVYKYCPDSPSLAQTAQRLIRYAESCEDEFSIHGPATNTDAEWAACQPLYDFSLKVIREGRASNLSLWYYTVAYLSDQKGHTQQASNLLAKAECSSGDQFIKESIRILRIYIDAKLQLYNASYEKSLFAQLQWLDQKIRSNINERVEYLTADRCYYNWNFSYYYWNDMLRKIVLSVIVPRYIAQGNMVRAIQLANMADNDLPQIVGKRMVYDRHWTSKMLALSEYRNNGEYRNEIDYSNALFALVDTIGVKHVAAYEQRLQHPRTAFDRFINDRSYTNSNFFKELIGTQYLREMRYGDALKYFEQIPASFQYTLNTCKDGYMRRDPFSIDTPKGGTNGDYKYNFAREMHSLEQAIRQTKDPNRKAQLQIRYAIGLRNSIDQCWALTQYYRGEYVDWTEYASLKRANAKSEQLIKESISMVTHRESAAYSYWLLGNRKTVKTAYSDTHIGEYLHRQCDNLCDYTAR